MDGGGHDGTNVVDCEQFVDAGCHQAIELAEVARKVFGRGFADLANAQGVEKARQGCALALVQGRQQIGCALVGHALQRRQARRVELIELGQRGDGAAIDKLVNDLVAQTFDVHRAPSGEVQYGLLALRWAEQAAGAAMVDATTFAQHSAGAHRADLGHAEVGYVDGARRSHAADDLGDHVARAAHDDLVADAHAFAPQLEEVVQGGVAHRCAAHEHGLELCDGRELARAPDLDVDAAQQRGLLLRRVLVRHRPTWLARDEAQAALQLDTVDFVDHAIDVERQGVAALAHGLVKVHEVFRSERHRAVDTHRQAERSQRIERGAVRLRRGPAYALTQAIGEEAQGPLGRHAGVELAHRASGGVARVDESLAAMLALRFVHALEVGATHVDLAAHFKYRWRVAVQTQRDLRDGADVLRHVLAALAVTARRGLHQSAVLIAQVDRQAIELELGGIGHRGRVRREFEFAPHARVEVDGTGSAGVGLGADTEHSHAMLHRGKARKHLADNALRRRVECQQLGMRVLDGLQLGEQPVVLGVRDLRVVEDVVAVRVMLQRGAQLGGALCDCGFGACRHGACRLGACGHHTSAEEVSQRN